MHATVAVSRELKCALLEGLSRGDHDAVMEAASLRRVPAKNQITKQGFPANRLFLLVKGCARYYYTTPDGGKLLLRWIEPGEILGALALTAKPTQYLVSVETVKDSEVLVWDRDVLRSLAREIPRLLDNALLISAEYLEWALTAYTALTCNTARERLAKVLISYGRAIGEESREGLLIDVTNEELANSAHITKYTTCRLLSEWQKNFAVAKRRGKILLLAPERLLIATR
jgi:CRP-like cAMP-binding protein